jgi:hypothetical protein
MFKNPKSLVGMLLASLIASVALVSCGEGFDDPGVVYVPDARGPVGQCYYVLTPAECGDVPLLSPVLMPISWHSAYYGYYDSPSYYNSRVPVSVRNTYVTNVTRFESSHRSDLDRYGSQARWKGSDGKVKTGKVQSVTFSGGSRNDGTTTRRITDNGGGSRSSYKGGGTSVRVGSGGGSYGGGSRSR